MDDLVQWLRAQLDEDEQIARAVEDRSAPWDGQWMADGDSAVRTVNGHVLFYRHDSGPLKPGLADYVAEWDPARVLRDIDAKRAIVARYEFVCTEASRTTITEEEREVWVQVGGTLQSCVLQLALPYTDRPGYRDEWRP
jgi:hypothetical protein